MIDRPTPETDAFAIKFKTLCGEKYWVPVDIARKLERERDEAREELHDIRLNLGADAEGYTLVHAVCVLQQERDEAREDRENSRQSLAFALEELDEARKEAHRFRALHYSHLGINASASWVPWEEKLGHE
jgi:hypothetical protein